MAIELISKIILISSILILIIKNMERFYQKVKEENILRPTVIQSIKYRKEIEKHFIDFLKSFDKMDFSERLVLDIFTAINHELQHQELMVYDFQHYFNRFTDESDNYYPKRRNKKIRMNRKNK